jgi:hypothetical protein
MKTFESQPDEVDVLIVGGGPVGKEPIPAQLGLCLNTIVSQVL